MAIFSKKPELQEQKQAEVKSADPVMPEQQIPVISTGRTGALIIPRISEKSTMLNRLNKYVFKVEGKVNKVELRKAIEKAYGAQIQKINMIAVKGKPRRYGRTFGTTSSFKKAVVTLKPGSKPISSQ
jgi:large subunit ribosomal protein L23